MPIQESSTFAAMRATPCWMTAGNVMPIGRSVDRWNEPTTSATAAATAFGVAGCGVGTLNRSAANSPTTRLTGAALMPVPPMSMPKAPGVEPCCEPDVVVLMAASGSPSGLGDQEGVLELRGARRSGVTTVQPSSQIS